MGSETFISSSSLHYKTHRHSTNYLDKENQDYIKLWRNQGGRKYSNTQSNSAQVLNVFAMYTASVIRTEVAKLCILRLADRIPLLHIIIHINVTEVPRCRCRDMVVGTQPALPARRSGVRITAGARDFSPKVQTGSGGPTHSPIQRVQWCDCTTHLNLAPRLRKSWAMPLLPLYAFVLWSGNKYSYFRCYTMERLWMKGQCNRCLEGEHNLCG